MITGASGGGGIWDELDCPFPWFESNPGAPPDACGMDVPEGADSAILSVWRILTQEPLYYIKYVEIAWTRVPIRSLMQTESKLQIVFRRVSNEVQRVAISPRRKSRDDF